MFKFLDKQREKLNRWLKKKTTMDFFDWSNLVLFLLGLGLSVEIWYFYNLSITELMTAAILWFTAIIILQYTKETYWLKQIQNKQIKEARKNRYLEKMPMIRLISWNMEDKDLSTHGAQKTFIKEEDKHFYKIIYKNIGDDWAFIENITLWVANPLSFQEKVDINYPSFKKTLFKGEDDIIATYHVKTRLDNGSFLFLYPSKLRVEFKDRYNHRFIYIAEKTPHLSEPTPFLGLYNAISEKVIYPSDLR